MVTDGEGGSITELEPGGGASAVLALNYRCRSAAVYAMTIQLAPIPRPYVLYNTKAPIQSPPPTCAISWFLVFHSLSAAWSQCTQGPVCPHSVSNCAYALPPFLACHFFPSSFFWFLVIELCSIAGPSGRRSTAIRPSQHQTGANTAAISTLQCRSPRPASLVDAARAFSCYNVDAHRDRIEYSSPPFHHIPLPLASIYSNPGCLTLARRQTLRARAPPRPSALNVMRVRIIPPSLLSDRASLYLFSYYQETARVETETSAWQ
ncbi:hypothetical protein K438DRAFT_1992496 [Mycena galopus ATCC 62051]|nr:hypothetical protein K438DRAFT_1992496 [Mycena galopus ATCC 62051]